MVKLKPIEVPLMFGNKEINYLSDWHDFDSYLPQGKVILSKGICGCGATEYYLRSNKPVVLASPRIPMIHSKLEDNGEFPEDFHCYEPVPQGKNRQNLRQHPIYYFSREDSAKESPNETISKFERFLNDCMRHPEFVPKVIVTFDSFIHVIETLTYLRVLDSYDIVVDEATCIFTDARQKGLTYLKFINILNALSNHIVYVSATPIREEELDVLPEFCNIPYQELHWHPSKLETYIVTPRRYSKLVPEVKKIIKDYQKNSYFQTKYVKGVEVKSCEAVFFINNVDSIIRIINACGLTNEDTRVICSIQQKDRLEDIGFEIDFAPGKNDYRTKNKTYTFVTRSSFEGADFYSDCSSTYVFADPKKDCLCLDISIDLQQIAGRCRTKTNPFHTDIWYYYQTADDIDTQKELNKVEWKYKQTLNFINGLQSMPEYLRSTMLQKLRNAQQLEKYGDDYIDVLELPDKTCTIVCNHYVYCQDKRAIAIKKEQYKSSYTVYGFICQCDAMDIPAYERFGDKRPIDFCKEFNKDNDFVRRMKLYVDTLDKCPDLLPAMEYMTQIPRVFKRYYRELGSERIKAMAYRQADLDRSLKMSSQVVLANIRAKLDDHFVVGQWYSVADIKDILNRVYFELGIKRPNGKNAPATEITTYYKGSVTKTRGVRGFIIND